MRCRLATEDDIPYLKTWLMQEGVLRYFPMINEREVDDALRIWVEYIKMGAALTCLVGDEPVGMANLYIQTFACQKHQCLFSITVDEKARGKGVGTYLMQELMKLAKETFNIEVLHLEVYDGNPAKRLYERLGFKTYGIHEAFLKEDGKYIGKVMMEKEL